MIKQWPIVPVAFIAAGTIALAGCGADRSEPKQPEVVQTAFAGLKTAQGEPTLPGLRSARPAAGAVERLPGPFDERFELAHLELSGGTVSGELSVTSDVSALLDLQVLAGFYDSTGAYLGEGRFNRHTLHEQAGHAEGDHEHDAVDFSITAPEAFRAKVASAAVGVPVLVNE